MATRPPPAYASWEAGPTAKKGYEPAGYDEFDYESGLPVNAAGMEPKGFADLDQQLRLGFIRKVYGILSLQLGLTFAVASVCILVDSVRVYVLTHPGFVYLGFVLSIGLLIALLCYKDVYPTNMALLAAWTFVEAYTVGVICATYASVGAAEVVVQAAGLTLAIFLGLTIFTFQSKIDFTFLGGALFALLWVMVLWGFVNLIFGYQARYLYALLGAVVFSLYILYDTSLLMTKLGYDQYILATISLYLDILNLFMFILQLLGDRRRS